MSDKKDQCRVTKKELETAAKELSIQLDYEKNSTAYLGHLLVPDDGMIIDQELQNAARELNRELALERAADEQAAIEADYSFNPEPYLDHLSAPHISLGVNSNPSLSDASYAALVRLYIEWMEMSEDEQLKFVERNVKIAGKMHKKVAKSVEGIPFYQSEHEMYGASFAEYGNEAWASLAERFTDVDAFALYLEENLKRCGKFPMSGDILRRAAQNMLEVMRHQQIKRSDVVSIDATYQDDDGSDIEIQIPDHSDDYANIVELEDYINYLRSLLEKNPVRQKVFDQLLAHRKKKDIAADLNISPAAVTKHVKEIHKLFDSI